MRPTSILVHPVGTTCNIACSYCLHRHTDMQDFSRKMKVETFMSFYEKWLTIIPDSVECEIIWHGGEPTLRGIDFYREILRQSVACTPPTKNVKHCVQTNGTTMNEDWAMLFKEYGVLVGVSMDGPQELHDSLRILRNGKGTFVRAISAYRILERYGVTSGIVVVVNQQNVEHPEKIFQFMKDYGILRLQLSPCMEFGEAKDNYSVTIEKFEYFICRLYDLWIVENNPAISIGFISDVVDHLLGNEHYNCLLSDRCHHFAVLDWTGTIKTCDGMRIRQQSLGKVGQNDINHPQFLESWRVFHENISRNRLEICSSCEWYKICHGGCPYHWPEKGELKTSFCQSHKKIFGHIATSIRSIYER